ncbi:MAG: YifB family Mg chelatase-like AAA ATPase [Acidimicrobiia bacterium]
MFAAVTSVALVGVEPRPVRVEVHVGGSNDSFHLVGLPDTAIREAKERVRAAFASSGYNFPNRRVIVNLAPADIPKAGSAYDLPIALGVLAASGEVPPGVTGVVALGELALDGSVRPTRGGLGAGIVARSVGTVCLLPPESAAEASLVEGVTVKAVTSLPEAIAVASGELEGSVAKLTRSEDPAQDHPDLAEVRGQRIARRALAIAAAGGHHLILRGPPGAGKTMLARCLPGLLPPLTDEEVLEVAQAWAAAGRKRAVLRRPPFRSPHHTATTAAIVGGGSGVPLPGELSLAHRGVLFLDELGEFPSHLLNSLRQPIEEGEVVVARSGASVRFPCSTQVVAATNPCPCGYAGDRVVACRCSPRAVERYRRRLSGPLLDRFDLYVPVPRLAADEIAGPGGEPSAAVRERVVAARARQAGRGALNRDSPRQRLDSLEWDPAAAGLLRDAVAQLGLTGRGWDRVRRVSRTIADLEGSDVVAERHLAEAISFRTAP